MMVPASVFSAMSFAASRVQADGVGVSATPGDKDCLNSGLWLMVATLCLGMISCCLAWHFWLGRAGGRCSCGRATAGQIRNAVGPASEDDPWDIIEWSEGAPGLTPHLASGQTLRETERDARFPLFMAFLQADLKELCKQHGQRVSGPKSELVRRYLIPRTFCRRNRPGS